MFSPMFAILVKNELWSHLKGHSCGSISHNINAVNNSPYSTPKPLSVLNFYLRRIQLQQNVQRHSFSFPHLLNVHTMQQTLQKLLLGYCTPIAAQVSRHVSCSHVQEMTDYYTIPSYFALIKQLGIMPYR